MHPLLIIKTGSSFPELVGELGDFEDWIVAGIGPVPMPVEIADARGGHALPDAGQLSGVVITGSHAMVSDHEAWSEALAGWLAAAVACRLPVLGICYGHQLLAHALGGEVDYHPDGIEIGTAQVHCTAAAADDPLFRHLPSAFPAQLVHSQSVRRLPPGARTLAGNAFEPKQAFRAGACAWGVQFHPEFSPAAMSAYIRRLAPELQGKGRDAAALQAAVTPTDAAHSLLRRFGAFAATVHR